MCRLIGRRCGRSLGRYEIFLARGGGSLVEDVVAHWGDLKSSWGDVVAHWWELWWLINKNIWGLNNGAPKLLRKPATSITIFWNKGKLANFDIR